MIVQDLIPGSPVSVTVDLAAPGLQRGVIRIPWSTSRSGWGNLYVPIVTIANGPGPTVLVLAGNHGDEYEGQIAALRLVSATSPEDVYGRLIIIPCLSADASRAGTRLWPDGTNFNRTFPGAPDGSPAEMLADFMTRYLIPRCDVVCDLHSGGRSLRFYPMSVMHYVDNRQLRSAMLDALLVWNTDLHMVHKNVGYSGLLPDEAERQGKVVVAAELGGGGFVTPLTVRLSVDGLTNVLRHFKVLKGEVVTRAAQGRTASTILDATDPSSYIRAPESGLFEPLIEPGETVREGQPVARIYYLERPDRLADVIATPHPGVVACVRSIPTTQQGDCIAVVARPVDRALIE